MDFQTIIVALIIFAALAYAGNTGWRKMKSFSSKNSCAADCGCSSVPKQNARKTAARS